MKSKQTNGKKKMYSSANDFNDKSGLKPIKTKSGKSKKISIYDELEDDDYDLNLDNFSYEDEDLDLDEDY